MRKIFLLIFFMLSIGWGKELFYYSGGKKHPLIAKFSRSEVRHLLPPNQRKVKATYYRTLNNDLVGIGDRIIVGVKNKKILEKIVKKYRLKVIEELKGNMFVLKTPERSLTLDIANEIYEMEGVEFSHPDFIREKRKRSLDPYFSKAWHLENKGGDIGGVLYKRGADIDVLNAWKITKGEGAKVGIIDDAVDIRHEDLKNNIAGFKNYADASTDDPSPTARVGDYNGDWHGTSCAGLIVAEENDKGSVGVAPQAKLYAVKDGPYISDSVKAFYWLESQGVSVISNSWGTYSLDDALNRTFKDLYKRGRGGKGVLIIFASGNDGYNLDSPYYQDESESPYVLSVGASSEEDFVTSYSNYGKSLDILAPGSEYGTIVTTDVTGAKGYTPYDYTFDFAGTSAAAPIVAGVAALVLSVNPDLTAKDVIEILENTADKIGNIPYTNGRNDHYGYGRVNAYKAVLEAKKRRDSVQSSPPEFDEPQKEFVWVLYEYLFQREYDEEGFNYWVNEIKNGKTAAYVAKYFFLNSKEIKESNLSDEDFIRKIYKALLNRDVEKEGLEYWLKELGEKGVPRTELFNYVIFSEEFQNLCNNKYHITPFNEDDKLEAFVERFYSFVLQREVDPEGESYWVEQLKNKLKTASDIAMDFFNSEEFLNKNVDDETFVNIAYRTLLNRESEKEGRSFWERKLKEDMDRNSLIKEFINSPEFSNLAKEYDIEK